MRVGLLLSLLLLLGNLLFIDYEIFLKKRQPLEISKDIPTPSLVDSCHPLTCPELIRIATASIVFPTPKKEEIAVTRVSTLPREQFIPFGSGSTDVLDWTDVAGLEAEVDSTKYGRIKTVVFEATIRIPTGNEVAYVRLFNVTDKHPVWFSEVSVEGGTPKLVASAPLTLDSGNKLYRVQMKTSLRHLAILDQARLRITAE